MTDFQKLLGRIGHRMGNQRAAHLQGKTAQKPAPGPEKKVRGAGHHCLACEDRGYVVQPHGDLSRAHLCRCSPSCPSCGDRGFSIVDRDGYEFLQPCTDCAGLKHRIALFNQARVPAIYAGKNLEAFSIHTESLGRAHQQMVRYARTFPIEERGLLLVGAPGVGKTHLMAGLIRHLTLEKGIPCLFKDFFLLLSELKEAWDTGGFQSDIMKPLGEVDVLVVDELGKGRNSDWEINLLDEIVCKRYNRKKTTLFTTNYPIRPVPGAAKVRPTSGRKPNLSQGMAGLPTLEERVSERVWSRLSEMCRVIEIESPDFRSR